MGLLDQTNGKSYLDYYRNYRGPSYNWEWAKQTTAPTTTAAQAQIDPRASQIVGGNGGDGDKSQKTEGDRVGGFGLSSTQEKGLGMGINAMLGMTPLAAITTPVNMALTLAGQPTIGQRVSAAISQPGYNKSDEGAFGGTKASFEGRPVDVSYSDLVGLASSPAVSGGYDAFSDSQSLSDAVAGGNWGGSADSDSYGGGYSGGSYGGLGGDFGGAGPGDAGWKKGGMIKNRRGLLDGEETSDAKTFKGLLSGPITDERDNIPAVNKTTGEKIAVESGEFVMTRKAVRKKGAKFFEKINKDAEKGK